MKLCLVLAVGLGAFAVALAAGVTAGDEFYATDELQDAMEAPRPLRDRFRIVQTNLTAEKLETEITDFTNYRCERMVVITNEAEDWFRIWCSSHDDKLKETIIYRGESMDFTFKPKANGKSEYRCVVHYKARWASFQVYNEDEWYTCPRDNELVYRYYVRHDGIYADKNKIRALFKGHDEYTLWEKFNKDTNQTDGLLMTGNVDGGMCSDIPLSMNDRASAVTVCDHQCVILCEHYRCYGKSRKFQARDGCTDFHIQELDKKLSAVKGC